MHLSYTGQAKRSALNLYDELSKCIERAKIGKYLRKNLKFSLATNQNCRIMTRDLCVPITVDVAKPLTGDRHTLYVAKWVDYTNKYGFGFQLSDGSVGVLFNYMSWMTLSPTGR